jgi:hypothetical protein
MQIVKINSVRDSIQDELMHDARKDLLQHLLSRGAKITIFAGAVRDTILAREYGLTSVEPRDWDIGIAGIPRREFDGLLCEVRGLKNRYGGFKLLSRNCQTWELWRQEDTVGLRKTKSSFSLKNLLRSFVLQCNAIAFDLDKGFFHDHGALRSIARSEISVLEDAIMHDWEVFAAKALTLTFRRPLKLDTQMERFVFTYLKHKAVVHEIRKAYLTTEILFGVTRIKETHGRD